MKDDLSALSGEVLGLIAEEDPLNDAVEGFPHDADRLADLHESAQREIRSRAAAFAALAAGGLDTREWVDRAVVLQQAEALIIRIDARLVEHHVRVRPLGAWPAARRPAQDPAGQR